MAKPKNNRRSFGSRKAGISPNKVKQEVIGAVRGAWTRYDLERKAVVQEARREYLRFNKDGTVSKRPDVFHTCKQCQQEVKEYHVDHVDPVGKQPLWPITGDGRWERYFMRIFCSRINLQVLCIECHASKTRTELENGAYDAT